MAKKNTLDKLDFKILSILMKDARIPYTEIAKSLSVSGGTIHVRMKKLEEMGVVKSAHLELDYTMLGYDITSFLGIFLERSSMYDKVVKDLKEITEVVGAHYTTGQFNIFVKIICKDTNHLRKVIQKIQEVNGVQRTDTFISLEESVNKPLRLK